MRKNIAPTTWSSFRAVRKTCRKLSKHPLIRCRQLASCSWSTPVLSNFDLGFQGFKEEVPSLPGDYSPPTGCILLAYQDSELAGCVALRPFAKSISEMKRPYVRHKFQGRGIGRALATAALRKASVLDYQKLRLDAVPSMKAAIQMYLESSPLEISFNQFQDAYRYRNSRSWV
jgi:ribosomal protein S18 acetylase RimI-like enzyme